MNFENKLVAVLNKTLEPGVALNALGHMVLGVGGSTAKEKLLLGDYRDAQGNTYPNISQMPFIVLRGTSGEIRKLVVQAREHKITHGVFLNTMTGGTYVEQMERTSLTAEDALIYYGAVLIGPWDTVAVLTKKLSLWR